MKEEMTYFESLLLFWPEKAGTLWKTVGGNRDAYVLWRETTCVWSQWRRTCCSSCMSLALHKSQVG